MGVHGVCFMGCWRQEWVKNIWQPQDIFHKPYHASIFRCASIDNMLKKTLFKFKKLR